MRTNVTFKFTGGASSSYSVMPTMECHRTPRDSSKSKNASSTAKPGIVGEWPRAGWGPGSLTVSRPPLAAKASETAAIKAAVAALSPSDLLGVVGVEDGGTLRMMAESRSSIGADGRDIANSVHSSTANGGAIMTRDHHRSNIATSNAAIMAPNRSQSERSGMHIGQKEGDLAARTDSGNGCSSNGGSKQGATIEEDGNAMHWNGEILDMLFSGADEVIHDGGFTTDGSKAATENYPFNDHSTAVGSGGGGGLTVDANGIGDENPPEEPQLQQPRQQHQHHQQEHQHKHQRRPEKASSNKALPDYLHDTANQGRPGNLVETPNTVASHRD